MPKKDIESIKDKKASCSKVGIFIKLVLILLFLALAASCTWYFIKYQEAKKQITLLSSSVGQGEITRQEISEILAMVGKHIVLPAEEEPVVATIEDVEALAEQQSFFLSAKNGNKLIIYRDKAIIYDLANDILVNVGPVYIQGSQE